MARRLSALRVLTGLLLGLPALAPAARAGDDPAPAPAPAPKSAPPVPVLSKDRGDLLDVLIDRLLSSDADVRAQAEADLAKAPAESLREIVRRMRTRLSTRDEVVVTEPTTTAVSQEVRWSLVRAADLRPLLGVDDPAGDPVLVAPAADVEKRWADASASGAVETVAAPRLTTYDGQKGTIDVLDQRSYVGDYEVESLGSTSVANPVVQCVQTGSTLTLTAHVAADSSRVTTAIDADLRRLVEPMAEERVALVKGADPVRVQRPEVVGFRWQRTISVSTGAGALVVFPRGFYVPADKRLVLQYRASVVVLPKSGPAPGAKPLGTPPEPPRPATPQK